MEDEITVELFPAQNLHNKDLSSGPCEDSTEVSAPYINLLPEESNSEDGSALEFKTPVAYIHADHHKVSKPPTPKGFRWVGGYPVRD